MPTSSHADPILTLEPLLEAVREGLEASDWELSGLQKTTSYEFEGRWAGDSSRSAYLFFHRGDVPEWVSIDVFLDETSRGLRGNMALVVQGPELSEMRDPGRLLGELAAVAEEILPSGYRVHLTLRYRLPKLVANPDTSETELRFKLHVPKKAMEAGHSAVSALAATTATAFHDLLRAPGLAPYLASPESVD